MRHEWSFLCFTETGPHLTIEAASTHETSSANEEAKEKMAGCVGLWL